MLPLLQETGPPYLTGLREDLLVQKPPQVWVSGPRKHPVKRLGNQEKD